MRPGGAGAFSDGLLNLHPSIGGDLEGLAKGEAWRLIDEVDSAFLSYGAPDKLLESAEDDEELLRRKAAASGARFVPIKQRHMGSDKTPQIIAAFKEDLERKGLNFCSAAGWLT